MRNRVLGLIVLLIVVGLAVPTLGETLASFSDIETSQDNLISTGSLDLKVNGGDDPDVGPIIEIENVCPGTVYGPFSCEVRNDGEAAQNPDGGVPPAYLYIHFKQITCANINPLYDGYEYPAGSGIIKPEPELVAEYGGKVDCTEVPGLGVLGDECTMKAYTVVTVSFDGKTIIENHKLDEIECQEIYLGELEPSGMVHTVEISVQVSPISEADAIAAGILGEEYFGSGSVFWYWPTNGLMCDKVSFSTAFELFQFKL